MFICWWEQSCRDSVKRKKLGIEGEMGQVHLQLSRAQGEAVASGRSRDRVPGRLVGLVEGRCGRLLPTRSVFSKK